MTWQLAFEIVERLANRTPGLDDRGMTRDLHEGFRDPRGADASELTCFLEEVDRLPGIRAIQRAIRAALALEPGLRMLDAGCGIGLETERLAEAYPEVSVTGVDRDGELLEIARRRARRPNLTWRHADLTAFDLPDSSFDVIRTERVLMYLPDDAVDELVRLLAPGGRLALFELDYGATILAPGSATDAVVERAGIALRAALPQPWAGRRIPRLLTDRGLERVTAAPFSFAVAEPVWRRIVHASLLALDAGISSWLDEQAAAAARGEFVAAFTGILTTASGSR